MQERTKPGVIVRAATPPSRRYKSRAEKSGKRRSPARFQFPPASIVRAPTAAVTSIWIRREHTLLDEKRYPFFGRTRGRRLSAVVAIGNCSLLFNKARFFFLSFFHVHRYSSSKINSAFVYLLFFIFATALVLWLLKPRGGSANPSCLTFSPFELRFWTEFAAL